MGKFVITSQLSIQPDIRSIERTRNIIKSAFGNLSKSLHSSVRVDVDTRTIAAAKREIQSLNTVVQQTGQISQRSSKGINALTYSLGRTLGIGAGLAALFQIIRGGVRDTVAFEDSLIKLKQVTGSSETGLEDLRQTILGISTSYGVSSKSLADNAKLLYSSGVSAAYAKQELELLAKTHLASSFADDAQTVSAMIALTQVYGLNINQLHDALGAVATVSAKFATESSDIIDSVTLAGGAFKAAGSNVNDLIELFTLARTSTRENAKIIGRSLRSIAIGLQDPAIEGKLFTLLNVRLRNSKGQFIGVAQSVRLLQEALKGVDTKSEKFVETALAIGHGTRSFNTAQALLRGQIELEKIHQVVQRGGNELERQVAERQNTTVQSFRKLREELVATIDKVKDNSAFQALTQTFLDLSHGALSLASSLSKLSDIKLPPALLSLAAGALGGGLLLGGKSALTRGVGGLLLGSSVSHFTQGNDLAGTIGNASIAGLLAASATRNINLGRSISRPLVHAGQALENERFSLATQTLGTGLVGAGAGARGIGSRINRAAGIGLVGNAIGSQIGGTTGNVIQGASTGAGIGFLAGGPLGAGIGAVVGALYAFHQAIDDDTNSMIKNFEGRRIANAHLSTQHLVEDKIKLSPENVKYSLDLIQKIGLHQEGANREPFIKDVESIRTKLLASGFSKDSAEVKQTALVFEHLTGSSKQLIEQFDKETKTLSNANTALTTFDKEILQANIEGSRANQRTRQIRGAISAQNVENGFDFGTTDFSQKGGINLSSLRDVHNNLPNLAKAILESGGPSEDSEKFFQNAPLGIRAALSGGLGKLAVSAKGNEIQAALEQSLAPLSTAHTARNSAIASSLAAQQQFSGLATSAQVNADTAKVGLGLSGVTQSIFGQDISPELLGKDILSKQAGVHKINAQLSGTVSPENAAALTGQRNLLISELARETNALKLLGDSSAELQHSQEKLNQLQNKYGPQKSIAETRTFGSREENRKLDRTFEIINRLGAGGSVDNLTDEQRQNVGSLLHQFGSNTQTQFGGLTGSQLSARLVQQKTGFNVGVDIANQEREIAEKTESNTTLKEHARVMQAFIAANQANNLINAANQFNNFANVVANFKSLEIKHTGNFDVNVAIAGGETFTRMLPTIRELIIGNVTTAINKHIEINFPQSKRLTKADLS